MLSLSVYESIAKDILHGEPSPNLGEGVELGARVWHPAKVIRISKICLLEPKGYLSPFTSQSQKKFWLGGPSQNLDGGGVELGVRLWYPVKAHHTGHNLFIETDAISLFF